MRGTSSRTVGATARLQSDDVEFSCPRCSRNVESTFYGPCETCRTQLRATFRNEARVVEVAEYEPKMNVTPNAVALKDD
jgi:hypothetical protein